MMKNKDLDCKKGICIEMKTHIPFYSPKIPYATITKVTLNSPRTLLMALQLHFLTRF